MAQFCEHPDGLIIITTDDVTYSDTREAYIGDHKWQLQAMPEGAVTRVYDDEHEIHQMMDAKGNHHWNGPVPWEFGDRAIADVSRIAAAKTARLALLVPPPAPPINSTPPTNVESF